MSHPIDTITSIYSSSYAPSAYLVRKTSNDVNVYRLYHPGGLMTSSLLLCPENKNRLGYNTITHDKDITNMVGTSSVQLSFGQPMSRPLYSVYSSFSQKSMQLIYTGPIYAYWLVDMIVSSSWITFVEFVER